MSQKTVIGIGNPLGGDDAVGSYVARKINEVSHRTDITAIDTGAAPESYSSVVRRNQPEHLILVDASDMGLPPGSIKLLSPDKIATTSFSTHQMPLSAFVSYVSELCRQVYIIGIQPEDTTLGDKLSDSVQKSAEHVIDLILNNRLDEINALE